LKGSVNEKRYHDPARCHGHCDRFPDGRSPRGLQRCLIRSPGDRAVSYHGTNERACWWTIAAGKRSSSSLVTIKTVESMSTTRPQRSRIRRRCGRSPTVSISPYGITTDKSGNLYVANLGDDSVTVYAPNSSKPKTTIKNGLNDPFDVKVDGFGDVYVANNPNGADPFIQEYAKGASQPSSTWTAPVLGVITGIALLDPMQKGETSIYALEFAAVQSGGTGELLSCYPGNSNCKSAGYTFGVTGGIAVAESPGESKPFEFLVADNAIPGVDTFVSGQLNGQLVTPGSPAGIALNAMDNRLYVASGSSESVVEYSFPGNKVLNTFTPPEANVFGVATTPAGTYH
jgi:hypothetical protein